MEDKILRTAHSKIFPTLLKSEHKVSPYYEGALFYASMLPFCQIRYVLSQIVKPEQTSAFFREFYGSVGKGIHSTFQKHLGLNNMLWGDWQCIRCKRIQHGMLQPYCCNIACNYVETKLQHSSGIVGKIDGLIPWSVFSGEPESDEFVLFELKTKTSKKLEEIVEVETAHEIQCSVYVHILRERGFKIKAALVVYVSQENPRVTPKPFVMTKFFDYLSSTISEITDAKSKLVKCEWDKLDDCKICGSMEDAKYCVFKTVCMNPRPLSVCIREFINPTGPVEAEIM
jgi:hypothetical protein